MESVWMAINRLMGNGNVVHVWNGILLSYKEKSLNYCFFFFLEKWMDLQSVVLSDPNSERQKLHFLCLSYEAPTL